MYVYSTLMRDYLTKELQGALLVRIITHRYRNVINTRIQNINLSDTNKNKKERLIIPVPFIR